MLRGNRERVQAMIVLIHDLQGDQAERLVAGYGKDTVVVSDDGSIKHCLGCFGCWTKDPGACIIKDKYSSMGSLLGACRELHIVSECVYGGFSPFIKNVLDRSISYVHPDFRMREGKTHHRLRYDRPFQIYAWFYGEALTENEQKTARELLVANSINMGCPVAEVHFLEDIAGLEVTV